jgi:hypothetical protein
MRRWTVVAKFAAVVACAFDFDVNEFGAQRLAILEIT